MKITRVLTDNGRAFTDRLSGPHRWNTTGQHEFDQLCADLGIEHRHSPPMRPQTNGMFERFKGQIEDVLQSHHFRTGEKLAQTIRRYVHLHNSLLPQTVLKCRLPIAGLKAWQHDRPNLFRKRIYNHAGCDTQRRQHDQQASLAAPQNCPENGKHLKAMIWWLPCSLAQPKVCIDLEQKSAGVEFAWSGAL